MITISATREVVERCTFPDYQFRVSEDGRGAWYMQASYEEADVLTGVVETQWTRRWFLSPEMSVSEIVQTAFKCCLTSMEHRTREFFHYRERAVFGPHCDVEALWKICQVLQGRPLTEAPA